MAFNPALSIPSKYCSCTATIDASGAKERFYDKAKVKDCIIRVTKLSWVLAICTFFDAWKSKEQHEETRLILKVKSVNNRDTTYYKDIDLVVWL